MQLARKDTLKTNVATVHQKKSLINVKSVITYETYEKSKLKEHVASVDKGKKLPNKFIKSNIIVFVYNLGICTTKNQGFLTCSSSSLSSKKLW